MVASRALNRERIRKWTRELSRFFSAQIGITALNLISGLLILRFLPKFDYALYTVGFAAINVFTQVSNSGVTPIVNAIAGRSWKDRARMGSVLNTAIGFRKRVGLALALPIGVYCVWQYRLLGVDYGLAVLLTVTFGLIGLLTIETSLLSVPFIYAKEVFVTQRIEIGAALAKLGLIICAGLLLPSAFTIALATTVAIAWVWRSYRSKVTRHIDLAEPQDAGARAEIWGLFKLNAPGTLYWSFQGQVTVLLCSIFATTENVAEIGALGRLTMIFAILNTFVAGYLLPEISKAVTLRRILQVSLGIIGIFALATAGLMGLAWLKPEWLLLILGDKYYNLEDVLLLFVGVSMISVFQSQVSSMCGSRGWMKWFALYIPVTLVAQVGALLVLDLATLRSIILFNGIVATASLLMSVGIYVYELHNFHQETRSAAPSTPNQ